MQKPSLSNVGYCRVSYLQLFEAICFVLTWISTSNIREYRLTLQTRLLDVLIWFGMDKEKQKRKILVLFGTGFRMHSGASQLDMSIGEEICLKKE